MGRSKKKNKSNSAGSVKARGVGRPLNQPLVGLSGQVSAVTAISRPLAPDNPSSTATTIVVTSSHDRREKGLKMLAYRAQGLTWAEIAPLAGYKNADSCMSAFYHAIRKGIIRRDEVDDPDDRLEGVIKPKIVDNLEALMNSPNERLKADVTLVAMKHVFKEAGQTGPATMTAIQVNVVLPEGFREQPLRAGTAGGMMADWEVQE